MSSKTLVICNQSGIHQAGRGTDASIKCMQILYFPQLYSQAGYLVRDWYKFTHI